MEEGTSGSVQDPVEETFGLVAARDVLPAELIGVLTPGFEAMSKVPDSGLDDVLTTRSAHRVLDAFVGFPPLRMHAARHARLNGLLSDGSPDQNGDGHSDQVGDPASGNCGASQLAARLVGTDSEAARDAAERVKALLDVARTERKAARRAARKQQRGTAEARAEERERTRSEHLRNERDRARRQREQAEAELAAALDRTDALVDEVEELQTQLAITQQQLLTLRQSLTDLPTAAQRLLEALSDTGPPEETGMVRTPPETLDLVRSKPENLIRRQLREAAQSTLGKVLPADVVDSVDSWLPELLEAVVNPPRLEGFTDLTLTVDVLGGGDHIGGSCVLVTAGGTRILVDCGTRPGAHDERSMAPVGIARALEDRIDAIVVTHAHNDHCGWVPAIVAKQPQVVVIATRATYDLLGTMWDDAAKVMRSEVGSERWEGGPLPPYSNADVHAAMDRLHDVDFGRKVTVGALTLELFPAGHIVGAAGVVVTAGAHTVVISGDVSGSTQMSVSGIQMEKVESALSADLMLLESTYAVQAMSPPRHKVMEDFVATVEQIVGNGGVALVPSFALGRAQEVALICAEFLPEVDVLVDGMARTISDIYERHEGPNRKPLQIFRETCAGLNRARPPTSAIRFKSGVVIATSGMLASGPAVTWARRVLPDPNSGLLLVGYQDPESPGQRLLSLTERGGGDFWLPNRDGTRDTVRVVATCGQVLPRCTRKR